jgi:phosphatidylserine decarboxylase
MPDGLVYGGVLGCCGLLVWRRLGGRWAAPLLGLGALVVAFFRDPDRAVPADRSLVVSPADGWIAHVGDGRVSIVLTLFDVHVNRAPYAGRVAAVEYLPGKFGNALFGASATQNEQNRVTLGTDAGPLAFTQIAGLFARRIVFWPRVGDRVERGERVGMIRFGSRTDVFLPPGAEPLVRVGRHVRGGSSAIARVPRRSG